jgi:hypothetical protein
MVFTLAGCVPDFGEMFGLIALVLAPCSVVFIGLFVAAMVISKRRWGIGAWIVVGWGIVYPIAQTPLAFAGSLEHTGGTALAALMPTLVTAALLSAVTRSPLAAAGCLAGLGLVAVDAAKGLVSHGPPLVDWWAMGLLWNMATGIGLFVWAWRARPGVVAMGHCVKCRYDLRATRGRVCPECGGEGTRGGAGKWS